MQHRGAFAECLYLLGNPNTLLSFHSIRAFMWRFSFNNRMYLVFHVRCQIFLPDFNQIWVVSTESHGKSQLSQITEIRLVRAALIHANRLTDIKKPLSATTVTRLKPINILSLLIMNISTVISTHFHSIKIKN